MAKDYSTGYQQGQADGASGDNRLALRAFKRLLKIEAYLPGFEGRDAEFFDGYKTGFRDKVRVIQTTPQEPAMPETQGRGAFTDDSRIERAAKRAHENPGTVTPAAPLSPAITDLRQQIGMAVHTHLGGSAMSATSFSHQVALLHELKQYLGQFQERLLGVSANYQRKVDELHSSGMMDETHARYVENELAETQALIARLVEHIGTSDIPRVENEIAYLESH